MRGKSKYPHYFSKVVLPVEYQNNKKAWMVQKFSGNGLKTLIKK